MAKLAYKTDETMEMAEAKLYVVHPLDDVPEQKCSSEGLGLMEMTSAVRWSLRVMRVYLLAMIAVMVYRVLALAHIFGVRR
jgi:hypothetical protein